MLRFCIRHSLLDVFLVIILIIVDIISISFYLEDENHILLSDSVLIFSPAFPAWCFSCSGPDQYYCLSVHLCTSSPWRCHDEDIQLVNALKGTKIEIHTEGRLMQMAQTWSWGCLSVWVSNIRPDCTPPEMSPSHLISAATPWIFQIKLTPKSLSSLEILHKTNKLLDFR